MGVDYWAPLSMGQRLSGFINRDGFSHNLQLNYQG